MYRAYIKHIIGTIWYSCRLYVYVCLPELASNHDISIKLLLLRTVPNIANHKMLDSLITAFNERRGRGECHLNWSMWVNLLRRICPCCHHLILRGGAPPSTWGRGMICPSNHENVMYTFSIRFLILNVYFFGTLY